MSWSRECCVFAPLSDSHLAVPKAFSTCESAFLLCPVLTCSHFRRLLKIKSFSKQIKLDLSNCFLDAS